VNDRTRITSAEVAELGLDDWRILFHALHARYRTGDFATGLRLVDAIAAAAEEADHHPDLDLRYGWVGVRLSSHDVGGVTDRDVRLARRITELAAAEGARPDPASLQVVELGLDTADHTRVRAFWKAVLGYTDSTAWETELVDPQGLLPTIWFQATDPHEPPRQRWHLDVRVPPEEADGRVRAALEAGGTVVDDTHAPTYCVLADPDGNRCCITTWVGRSH
jgi:4a-hydroxytetrahydrobiopterin dehydratase